MLITGGSRGIGRATALAAAEDGWDVALSWVGREDEARTAVAEAEAAGAKAAALRADVAREEDVIGLFDAAEDALGAIEAVVVNAGIVAPGMPLAQMTAERLRRMVDVNLMGALYTAREAARRLARGPGARSGAIVLVSSSAARSGGADEYVDYAATKGALDTLTVGLARELAGHNIRVNGVRPGVTDTEIHASGGKPDRAFTIGRQTPMGRPARSEEVAQAILWLCGTTSPYTTGAIIDVSGGR